MPGFRLPDTGRASSFTIESRTNVPQSSRQWRSLAVYNLPIEGIASGTLTSLYFDRLASGTNLRELHVGACPNLKTGGLAELRNCQHLTYLSLEAIGSRKTQFQFSRNYSN